MNETSIFSVVGDKPRLVEMVVRNITQLIVDSQLEPGAKLPPEAKLAERAGVSRTVVREALQVLTGKGLTETRHGIGTIVRARGGGQITDHISMMLHMNEMTLDNLHQVRSLMEVEIAGIAASQATAEEVRELKLRVDRLEQDVGDAAAYVSSDGEFHNYLASISHNPMFIILLNSVRGILTQVRTSIAQYPELYLKGVADHREIMERVDARDSEGARQVMRRHLNRARDIQTMAAKRAATKL